MDNGFADKVFSQINYKDILESIPVGTLVFQITDKVVNVVSINDRLIQFANLVHKNVKQNEVGRWNKDDLYTAFQANLYAFAVAEDVHIVKKLISDAESTGYAQCVFRLKGTSGDNTLWIYSVCTSEKVDEHTKIYYTLFMDYTNQKLYERQLLDKQKELEYISSYDSLTLVKNRYSYNKYLDDNRSVTKQSMGVVFADVNGLKDANDRYGHHVGDLLLKKFAKLLIKNFDITDIYRISGDEFVVLVENVDVSRFEKQATMLIEDNSAEDYASIGYVWEKTVVDVKQAVFKAEQLMMIQKRNYYVKNKDVESKHKPKILNKLLEEMSENRFMVYLQPKADIKSGRITGAEALIRKKGVNGEVILPYQFVPALEKELLISRIDFFVFEEICKLLKRWKTEGKSLIKISTNMSRVSVAEHDFIEHILEISEKYEIDPKYIELEITESVETKDDRKLIEIVSKLHDLGFGVALDDMGSDYSSIRMLTLYGVDMVKLDRSMVLQMNEKEGNAIIKHVIALCHEIDKHCIAEGVEDENQVKILQDMGCDYYQGFLLSKPIPIEEFEVFIEC